MSIESIYWQLTENYNQELHTSIRLNAANVGEYMYLSANSQPLQKDLMYYTTRSTVLVNRAWDDVPAIECYKSLVNRLTRWGRLSLMRSLHSNADDITYIRSSSKVKYSFQEEQQLAAMYNVTMILFQ